MKRVFALMLALMMVLSLLPTTVWAAGMTDIESVELRLVWYGNDSDLKQQLFSPLLREGQNTYFNLDQNGMLDYVYTGDKNGLTKEALEEQLNLNPSGPTFLENVALRAPEGYQLQSYTASDRNHGNPNYPEDGDPLSEQRLHVLLGEDGEFTPKKIDFTIVWEKIGNTSDTLTDVISLHVENLFGGGQQGGGSERPAGTIPISIYDDREAGYFTGVGMNRGSSVVFNKIYDSTKGNEEITDYTFESTTAPGLITAGVNNGVLTVTASADCPTGEQYVVVRVGDVRYSLGIMVNQSGGGQDGPPPFAGTVYSFIERNFIEDQGVWSSVKDRQIIASEWGSFDGEAQNFALQEFWWLGQALNDIDIVAPITKRYILSSDTAIDITIPIYLMDFVILPDTLEANNVLPVRFKNGMTAENWENIYREGGMRNFAMLSYTFRYIGEMQNPAYYTWNGQNGNSVEEEARRAEEGCKFGYDRGIQNGIVVANFQNDGEMMALPGNTNVNATSHEIIRWQGSPNAYSFLTDIVDTSNVEAVELDIDPTENYGKNGNWLDRLGAPVENSRVSLPQTLETLDGVTMTVSDGLVWTHFDSTKTLDVKQVLDARVHITPPAGAIAYRMKDNYTSTEPDAAQDAGAVWEADSMRNWLNNLEWQNVTPETTIELKPNTLERHTVGNIGYYIGENITGVHCNVIQWKMSDGVKTEYIYFNADPYVRTIETQSVTEITESVEEPTAVSGGNFTLNCRVFPQDNNGACYFRLSIWEDGSKVTTFDGETTYTVYIPYSYIGYSWNEAQNDPVKPFIQHYDNLHNPLERIDGEYTPYGIQFKTKSFSPFTVSRGENSGEDAIVVNGVGIYTEIHQGVPGYHGENHDGIRTVKVDPDHPHDCIQVPFHQVGDNLRLFLVTEDELNTKSFGAEDNVIKANNVTLTLKEKIGGKNVYWLELTPAGEQGFGFWVKKANGAELLDFWFEKRDDGGQGGGNGGEEIQRVYYTYEKKSKIIVRCTGCQNEVLDFPEEGTVLGENNTITVRVKNVEDLELWRAVLPEGFLLAYEVQALDGTSMEGLQIGKSSGNHQYTFDYYDTADESARHAGLYFAETSTSGGRTMVLPTEGERSMEWAWKYVGREPYTEDNVTLEVVLDERIANAIVLEPKTYGFVDEGRLHVAANYANLDRVLSLNAVGGGLAYDEGVLTYRYLGDSTTTEGVEGEVFAAAREDKETNGGIQLAFGDRDAVLYPLLRVDAPNGYHAKRWQSTTVDRSYYRDNTAKQMELRYQWCYPGFAQTFILTWASDDGVQPDIIEQITIDTPAVNGKGEAIKSSKWYDMVKDGPVSAKPINSGRIAVTPLDPTKCGAKATYDNGLVYTEFSNNRTLKVEPILDAKVTITPPENATGYKIHLGYDNSEPVYYAGTEWLTDRATRDLESQSARPIDPADESFKLEYPLDALKLQEIGDDIQYYYSADTEFDFYIVEWFFGDGKPPVLEYVQLKTSPYICTVTTDAVDTVAAVPFESNGVVNPVAVASKSDIKLTTRKYPQNVNGRYFFELEIVDDKSGNVIEEFTDGTLYKIILPYAFMGEEWNYEAVTAAGMKAPIINHYDNKYHQLVGNEGAIRGVFTERGIEFTVTSFSPFMLTWGVEGDVDMNNTVNGDDLTMLLRYLAKIDTLTKEQEQLADVDGVSGVNAADATVLARMIKNQGK